MHTIVRRYSGKGSAELFDLLEQRKAEVEPLMRAVPGFMSYTLARTDNGGFSVTVCQDQKGIEESARRAKEWIAKNGAHLAAPAPEVSVGRVVAHF